MLLTGFLLAAGLFPGDGSGDDIAAVTGTPAEGNPSFGHEPKPGEKDSFFSKEYIRLLAEDTKHVLSAPARWGKKEWLTVSAITASVAAVALADKPVWDAAQRNSSKAADNAAHILAKFGDFESLGIVVPFYTGAGVRQPEGTCGGLRRYCGLDACRRHDLPSHEILCGPKPAPRPGRDVYLPPLPLGFPAQRRRTGIPVGTFRAGLCPWVGDRVTLRRAVDQGHRVLDVDDRRLVARLPGLSFPVGLGGGGGVLGIVVGHAVVRFNEKMRRERKEQDVLLVPFIGRGAAGVAVTARF